jgi:hypothetical protein
MGLIALGMVGVYVGILALVLSLFNAILFVVLIAVIIRYVKWSINVVRNIVKKLQSKRIHKCLEKENKEYYSRKLIRWVYNVDYHEIVVHNLRLHYDK